MDLSFKWRKRLDEELCVPKEGYDFSHSDQILTWNALKQSENYSPSFSIIISKPKFR